MYSDSYHKDILGLNEGSAAVQTGLEEHYFKRSCSQVTDLWTMMQFNEFLRRNSATETS